MIDHKRKELVTRRRRPAVSDVLLIERKPHAFTASLTFHELAPVFLIITVEKALDFIEKTRRIVSFIRLFYRRKMSRVYVLLKDFQRVFFMTYWT